jgi:uncharacterized protein YegP (UPF0339 family)
MPPYFFWVYRDRAGEWRWALWSWGSGTKLADSAESFSSLSSCEQNIDLVKRVAQGAPLRYPENTL